MRIALLGLGLLLTAPDTHAGDIFSMAFGGGGTVGTGQAYLAEPKAQSILVSADVAAAVLKVHEIGIMGNYNILDPPSAGPYIHAAGFIRRNPWLYKRGGLYYDLSAGVLENTEQPDLQTFHFCAGAGLGYAWNIVPTLMDLRPRVGIRASKISQNIRKPVPFLYLIDIGITIAFSM